MQSEARPFDIPLEKLQPSQLYISQAKLQELLVAPNDVQSRPVPVKQLDGELVITDGHTRAYLRYASGFNDITAIQETDELDWEAYKTCVGWCREEGVLHVSDFRSRVVAPDLYEILWLERCRELRK